MGGMQPVSPLSGRTNCSLGSEGLGKAASRGVSTEGRADRDR